MNSTALLLAITLLLAPLVAHSDWLIENATVIDGSGRAAYTGDVALREGRIMGIGKLDAREGDQVLDARGMVLAPGFIDPHSHYDRAIEGLLDVAQGVSQGITTVVVGADGTSKWPLADWMAARERAPAAINMASFSGHGTLRRQVMGADYKRPARADELQRMGELLRADLEAGAFGLSSGLEYDPGIYSDTAELVALSKVAASHGAIYMTHSRSEDAKLDAALAELATIAREAKIPVQISHLKISSLDQWGRAPQVLERLDAWRAEGLDITADVYPYTYWFSFLTTLFPERRFDIESARFALAHSVPASGLIIDRYVPEPRYAGMSLASIAAERERPEDETLLWLIATAYPDGNIDANEHERRETVMGQSMSEEDVVAFLAWEHAMVCSDGALESGHPRGTGTFTRYLRHYVLDKDPSKLPDAIHRMTGKTAKRLGITDRGLIAQGRAADVVLLDPATVRDNAAIGKPHELSSGILGVWVNGERVWDGKQTTGARPGHILRHEKGSEGAKNEQSLKN
jgi:N-acyl-D-amino-acid deacylase